MDNLTPLRNRVQVWYATDKKDRDPISEIRHHLIDKITEKIIGRLNLDIDDDSLKRRARWEVNKMLDGKEKIGPEVRKILLRINLLHFKGH